MFLNISDAESPSGKKRFFSLKRKKGGRGRKPNKSKSMPHLVDLRLFSNGTQNKHTDHTVTFSQSAKGSSAEPGALQATSLPAGEAGSVVECTATDVSPGSTVRNLLVYEFIVKWKRALNVIREALELSEFREESIEGERRRITRQHQHVNRSLKPVPSQNSQGFSLQTRRTCFYCNL